MAENGNTGSGTVLQQLLAEHYSNEANAKLSASLTSEHGHATAPFMSTRSPSEPDVSLQRSETHSKSFEADRPFRATEVVNSRSDTATREHQSFPLTPRDDSGPAARLDALCRSTLDKSNNQQFNYRPNNPVAMEKNSKVVVTTPSWQPPNDLSSSNQNPPKHSAALQVLSRLRKELQLNTRGRKESDPMSRPPPPTYLEAQVEAEETGSSSKSGPFASGAPTTSPRYGQAQNSEVKHGVGSRSLTSMETNGTYKSPAPPSMLHGHPKSSSGGDEHLYTDRKKNNQRRGLRSKKNKHEIVRASSLHQNRDGSIHSRHTHPCLAPNNPKIMSESRSLKHLDTVSIGSATSPMTPNPGAPLHAKHFSSRSAPSQNSSQESITGRRRASLHGNLSNLQEVITTPQREDAGSCSIPTAGYVQICKSQEGDNVQKHQTMPHTPLVSQAPYVRDSSARYGQAPHGSFYPGMPNHVMVGQNPSAPITEATSTPLAPLMSALSGHSPPRPPPPPYPTSYGGMEGTEANEGRSWNPQRPNSLALGNFSKKKINNNGSSMNSPALASPSGNCFGTPMRGTAFYSNSKDSPYSTQNPQTYIAGNQNSTNSPHQRQTSNGSNSHLGRSGSGKGTRDMSNTSSSSSSTTTGNNTPSYPETPSFSDMGVRSPNGLYSAIPQNNHPQTYVQDGYSTGSSGSGVSKSDSLNSSASTTSNGGSSCISRRRKRNSSSKSSYGNASSSGSSSGSRPNSNDDLTDQLEIENENLRNRLESAMGKLRKYESIEMELTRINQQHQVLQQSANKREQLEVERFQQLTANLKRVESERNSFENQVATLTEQLKTANVTSPRDDVSDVTKDNSLIESYQAKNRKLAERERQLEEELEECRDRIAELTGDLDLVSTSLHKAQSTVKVLKDKFLHNTGVDTYTAQLLESMESLQQVVIQRIEMESLLRERLWDRLQQTARPLNSTSSNDEGISGMDAADPAISSSSDIELYNNLEDQMLGTKAEMLKWKQRYLEQSLLQQMRSVGGPTSEGHKRLCKALSKHRHAVSDPGLDKIIPKKDLPCLSGLAVRDSVRSTAGGFCDGSKQLPDTIGGAVNKSQLEGENVCRNTTPCCQDTLEQSYSNARTDCACQTPGPDWGYLGCLSKSSASSLCNKSLEATPETPDDCPSQSEHENRTGACATGTDSPSEGYHSQQSSGSPTPSTEKSSLHFQLGGEPASQSRDIHLGQFRRNRSADVLTSLDV